MPLVANEIVSVLSRARDVLSSVEHRLVGTASSVVRGISLPAADIDILFRDRAGLRDSFAVLHALGDVETAAAWVPEARQYFARLVIDGVTVELSTVEVETATDTMECSGPGPWQHFDELDLGDLRVPAVASELRLVTEVARARPDRVGPILQHLRSCGCDGELVRRGL